MNGERFVGVLLIVLAIWVFMHQVLGIANNAILSTISGWLSNGKAPATASQTAPTPTVENT